MDKLPLDRMMIDLDRIILRDDDHHDNDDDHNDKRTYCVVIHQPDKIIYFTI
jgi:hypothetical protein